MVSILVVGFMQFQLRFKHSARQDVCQQYENCQSRSYGHLDQLCNNEKASNHNSHRCRQI